MNGLWLDVTTPPTLPTIVSEFPVGRKCWDCHYFECEVCTNVVFAGHSALIQRKLAFLSFFLEMASSLYAWTFRDPFHSIFIETTTSISMASNAFLILITFSTAGKQIGAVEHQLLYKSNNKFRLLSISARFLCPLRYPDFHWTRSCSTGHFFCYLGVTLTNIQYVHLTTAGFYFFPRHGGSDIFESKRCIFDFVCSPEYFPNQTQNCRIFSAVRHDLRVVLHRHLLPDISRTRLPLCLPVQDRDEVVSILKFLPYLIYFERSALVLQRQVGNGSVDACWRHC